MAINALIAQGMRPIGADVPEVGNLLQQMQQRKAQNALAQQAAAREQQNADAYSRQVGLQADQRQAQLTKDQWAYVAQVGTALANAKTPEEFGILADRVAADPAYRSLPGALTREQFTPEMVRATLPEAYAKAGIPMPQAPVPFEQSNTAKEIDYRAKIQEAADRRRAEREIALERLRQQGRPAPAAATVPGAAPPQKPLPVAALRIVDEAKQAIGASSQSIKLIDTALAKLKGGQLNLGMVSNTKARLRNALGVSTPQSRAYTDLNQTLEKLRNNYLLLAKGVQTEGDATRAWNSEIGESVQNDNKLADQQLRKAKAMIEQAIADQNGRIETVYSNYGTQPNAPATDNAVDWDKL